MRRAFAAILVCWVSATLVVPTLRAELPNTCPVETARWPYGPSHAVSGLGSLAVLGVGASLRVLDISDPSTPVVLGELTLPDVVSGVEVKGYYAFVAAGTAGLRVVDLIDPANPVEVGSAPYDPPSPPFGPGPFAAEVRVDGDFAIVFGGAGCTIYDISQPQTPVERGTWNEFSGERIADLSISGDHFVVSLQSIYQSIHFVDFSDPDYPMAVGFYGLPDGIPDGLEWVGDLVYVGGWNYSPIWVVDATDPANPAYEWYVIGPTNVREIEILGNLAVLRITNAFSHGSISLLDISVPARPVVLSYGGGPYAADIWSSGSSVYVAAHRGGLQVIDISSPATPATPAELAGWDAIVDLVVAGNNAFVVTDRFGLVVLDVENPNSALEQDRIGDSSTALVKLAGSHAYLTTAQDLRVIDISDPSDLSEIGSCNIGFAGEDDLAVSGDVGFYPDETDARTIDLSIPISPTVVGNCEGPAGHVARVVDLGNDHAYVTFDDSSSNTKLQTCDVSNPATPFMTSRLEATGDPSDILVTSQHLATATANGIETFDLSNPAIPVADGWLALAGQPDRMDSLSNLLFATDVDSGGSLLTIDISDPSNPALVCAVPTAGVPVSVSQSGGRVFVAYEQIGYQVFGIPGLVFADDFESGYHHHWAPASP